MAIKKRAHTRSVPPAELPKCPTGIRGPDQIARGGLPRERPTLVCGGAGTGKTVFGIEFLVRGALEHGEPGVFVSFEGHPVGLVANTTSLGFGLDRLVMQKKLFIDQVAIDRSEIMETGEYNLDGLFIRLDAAIRAVQAMRIVLDTIEVLFGALSNFGILRAELRRLFAWLKDQGVTCIGRSSNGSSRMRSPAKYPYVMLTSSTQQEDIDRCYALGANSFVSKPVKFEAFVDTVSRLGMYWLLVNTAPAVTD